MFRVDIIGDGSIAPIALNLIFVPAYKNSRHVTTFLQQICSKPLEYPIFDWSRSR